MVGGWWVPDFLLSSDWQPGEGGRSKKHKGVLASSAGDATAKGGATSELTDEQQTLYCCRFGPATEAVAGGPQPSVLWLAYGGTAGLLRLQRLSAPHLS